MFLNKRKKTGFTLAEVLITLAVVGIVAAISLPSLVTSIQDRAWASQRKSLHTRLSQALSELPSLSVGLYTDENGLDNGTAEQFLVNKLATVYKINNVCSFEKMTDCGFTPQITPAFSSETIDFPKRLSDTKISAQSGDGTKESTKGAAFRSANGESIAIYVQPECDRDELSASGISSTMACINFVYDLNGTKAPNKVGDDIGFITAFYRNYPSVVAPVILKNVTAKSDNFKNSAKYCADNDGRLPSREEVAAMSVNSKLVFGNSTPSSAIWSSTPYDENSYYVQKISANSSAIDNIGELSTSSAMAYCLINNGN